MTRAFFAVAFLGLVSGPLLLGGACDDPQQIAKQTAPPPAPAKPPEAKPAAAGDAGVAKPKMVAPSDGLSLAERIAKREATEKKVAAELAKAEHDRLVQYDRGKLLHTQVFAFITKTRAAWDALERKLGSDKEASKTAVAKLAASQRASIVAMGKKMATIDPKGGNSNVTTDYDVMLNALANDYPDALMADIDGAHQALGEQKAELDKRSKKITEWLAELKTK